MKEQLRIAFIYNVMTLLSTKDLRLNYFLLSFDFI